MHDRGNEMYGTKIKSKTAKKGKQTLERNDSEMTTRTEMEKGKREESPTKKEMKGNEKTGRCVWGRGV